MVMFSISFFFLLENNNILRPKKNIYYLLAMRRRLQALEIIRCQLCTCVSFILFDLYTYLKMHTILLHTYIPFPLLISSEKERTENLRIPLQFLSTWRSFRIDLLSLKA